MQQKLVDSLPLTFAKTILLKKKKKDKKLIVLAHSSFTFQPNVLQLSPVKGEKLYYPDKVSS